MSVLGGGIARLRGAAQSHRTILSNATSMVVALGTTSLLGAAFWLLAARHFSQHAVGVSGAAVSAMTLLGFAATLGLGTVLMGELPQRRARAHGLLNASLCGLGCGRRRTGRRLRPDRPVFLLWLRPAAPGTPRDPRLCRGGRPHRPHPRLRPGPDRIAARQACSCRATSSSPRSSSACCSWSPPSRRPTGEWASTPPGRWARWSRCSSSFRSTVARTTRCARTSPNSTHCASTPPATTRSTLPCERRTCCCR